MTLAGKAGMTWGWESLLVLIRAGILCRRSWVPSGVRLRQMGCNLAVKKCTAVYLDTANKNSCYMLAAHPQRSRDRSLRHEMAQSHGKRQMESAFPEGPGESSARG